MVFVFSPGGDQGSKCCSQDGSDVIPDQGPHTGTDEDPGQALEISGDGYRFMRSSKVSRKSRS